MKVIIVHLEIKIDDENIHKLYPEFDNRFKSVNDFIESLYDAITTDEPDALEKLGYSVTIRQNSTDGQGYFSLN